MRLAQMARNVLALTRTQPVAPEPSLPVASATMGDDIPSLKQVLPRYGDLKRQLAALRDAGVLLCEQLVSAGTDLQTRSRLERQILENEEKQQSLQAELRSAAREASALVCEMVAPAHTKLVKRIARAA